MRHVLLAGVIAALFAPRVGEAQEEQELLVRVELVLESHDPSVDRQAVTRAVNHVQRRAHGRALTVLHVVVPVGGDAEVHVHALNDEGTQASESFVIPRGAGDWLGEALVQHVVQRLVPVHAPSDSLLLSWDGTRSIDAPSGLIAWHVLLVEDGTNLSTPPSR